MQGFDADDPALARVAPWLRWTPLLSTLLILTGTALRQPVILWLFAGLALVGATGWHIFDAIFNTVVRHAVGLPRLPRNPAPRRFAMLLAAVWASVEAVLFAKGWRTAGLVAGGMLCVAAITVATTQFCFGSWLWRLLKRQSRVAT